MSIAPIVGFSSIGVWIVIFLALGIGFYLFSVAYASRCIYIQTLKRKDKNSWSGLMPDAPLEQVLMDKDGMAWAEAHKEYAAEHMIERDGLRLFGEYYDMGYGRTVIILSGRTESRRYGYFFAPPYEAAGYNVMVLDPRAHGKSDGEYNTVGYEEGLDALEWAKYAHDKLGASEVIFHGICIGAHAGMRAITAKECPDYVAGLVTEGMFVSFWESMKNHIIEKKRYMPPVMSCVDHWAKKYTGHSMKEGPERLIGGMKKPLLMLQSKEDPYSTPECAQRLYDMCPSENKRIVYFEHGGHSLLRHVDREKYDGSILEFVDKNFKKTEQKSKIL